MQIEIIVREKIARTVDKHAYAVCGNSDYTVKFDFDEEWDAYAAKTARFKRDGEYTDVPFSGNECPMPVVANAYRVEIGVYAGDLHTTSSAILPLRRSILDGDEIESGMSQEIKDNLDKLLDDKLSRPENAAVGEFLAVEEVDENGVATKVKTKKVETAPPDWNQNDRTAKDYIKNRPFYSQDEEMVSGSYVDVLNSELDEIIEIPDNMNLIKNMTWYKPFPFLTGSGKEMLFHIIFHISGQSSDIRNMASMSRKENWSVIGGDNWKWDLGNTRNENFLLFFITDMSALDSAYAGMFTKTGIFLQRNVKWGYTYTKYTVNIGVTWLNRLSEKYISSAIERTENKVSEIVSGADAEQYPSVAAVEKYVGGAIAENAGENVVYIAKTGTNTYAVKRNASDENPMQFADLLALCKRPSTTVAVFDRYRLPLAALTDTGMIFESVYSASVFTVLVMQDNSAYRQSVTVMNAPLTEALEIPAWALNKTKPSYTASEVGAVAAQQAVSDAGKVLTVGDDGSVAPKEAGGGGTDLSLGLTSAQVGQIIKVKAVDDAGRPTEWEAGEMEAGQFRHIRTVTIPEDITTDTSGVNFLECENGGCWFGFSTDENGEPFELTELIIFSYAGGNSSRMTFSAATNGDVPMYQVNPPGELQVKLVIGSNGNKSYSVARSLLFENGYSLGWGASFGGGENNTMYSLGKKGGKMETYDYNTIRKIRTWAMNNSGYGFLAGSWFEFYGR